MRTKENARGQGGRKGTADQETELSKAHGVNDVARLHADKPSFDDAEFLARAGYELLRLAGKIPRDTAWTTREYDNTALIAEARERGGNLGVRLRPTDLVMDVDPRNGGDASLDRLCDDLRIERAAFPHVATGGGGHHYYMTKPADVRTFGKLASYPGIDFKSAGGQVVAPGSVHPETGRRYGSEFWMLGPDETPRAPAALLELLRVRRLDRPEGSGHDRWGELTPAMLAANLEKLDPDDFGEGRYEEWLHLAMACHHATAGEGRQEFIDWSTSGAGYEDHAEEIGSKWDGFHATASNGGRPITVAHLFGLVNGAGETPVDRADPADDFDVVEQDGDPMPALRRMKNGKPEASFHNCLKLVRYINPQLGLKFNEFDRAASLTADELPWSVDVGRRVNDDVLRLIRYYLVEGSEVSWGTGLPLSLEHDASSSRNPWAPSVDRIDCAIGYRPGNIRIVCWAFNQMRGDFPDEVVRTLAEAAHRALNGAP